MFVDSRIGDWLFGGARRDEAGAGKPLRDELLSIERLEERARALAATLHGGPEPAQAARGASSRGSTTNARRPRRRLSRARERRAPRRVHHAGGRVAARQLPPGRVRGARRPPEPAARLLPRAAQARAARAGRRRARLRHGRGADPPQRQPARPRSSSCGSSTASRRVAPLTIGELWAWPSMLKLALIENLRRLGGRGARRARGAPRRRRATSRASTRRHGRARRPLPRVAAYGRTSCSCCSACASTARGSPPSAPRSRTHLARSGTHRRGGDPRRASARRPRPRSRSRTSSRACASARRSTGAQYVEAVSLVEQRPPARPGGRLRAAWTS